MKLVCTSVKDIETELVLLRSTPELNCASYRLQATEIPLRNYKDCDNLGQQVLQIE